MGRGENHTAARHRLLEFYHRLWTMSDSRRIRSRTGCPAWFYLRILLHGPTPLNPHARGGCRHAHHRLSAAGLDASQILTQARRARRARLAEKARLESRVNRYT